MKRTIVASVAVSVLLVVGCASSDPAASEEYQALEQELTETEQQLAATEQQLGEVTAERDSLTPEGGSLDVGQGPVPDEVAALVDQCKQATETSMVDLYTPTGFHLYGTQKYTGDDIGAHLVNPAVGHEALTPLLLVADDESRYVVTQGFENTIGGGKYRSDLSWEIVTDSDGALKIAQSAWFKITT